MKRIDKGVKFDTEKPRMDLIPAHVMLEIGKRLADGSGTYGDRNWEAGMDWGRPYAALLRHLFAWWGGEDDDSDTSQSHLIAVICNAMFLYEYQRNELGEDTRGI